MFVFLITLSHFLVSNAVSHVLLVKYPKFRADRILASVLTSYGFASSFLMEYTPFYKDLPILLSHLIVACWIVVGAWAVVALVCGFCTARLFVLRKRVTLIPGHSYLLGGLFSNRNKPQMIAYDYTVRPLNLSQYDYVFKNGFRYIPNYGLIVKDFKKMFTHHSAMKSELVRRLSQQESARDSDSEFWY